MKKILTLLTVLSLSFTAVSAEDTFNYDEQNLNKEFSQLNKIENYVNSNEGATLESIQKENAQLLSGIELSNENSATFLAGDLPANIPPFLWGCVLGVIGILLVYILSDNDKDLTKKAVIGCLVGWGAGIVIYLIFVASIFGAAASAI
jgi:hypothetical protein